MNFLLPRLVEPSELSDAALMLFHSLGQVDSLRLNFRSPLFHVYILPLDRIIQNYKNPIKIVKKAHSFCSAIKWIRSINSGCNAVKKGNWFWFKEKAIINFHAEVKSLYFKDGFSPLQVIQHWAVCITKRCRSTGRKPTTTECTVCQRLVRDVKWVERCFQNK